MNQKVAASAVLDFVLGVLSSGFAFGLSCCGDICAVGGHGDGQAGLCLPLWADGEAARRAQRLLWPKLVVTRIALSEVREICLPKARAEGMLVGLGISVGEKTIVAPPELLEIALRDVEQYLREKAARR